MKRMLAMFVLSIFISCGKTSSPEGRVTLKIEALIQQMDSLRKENRIMMDSIARLREDINKIASQKK